MLTVGAYLAKLLEAYGIEVVFGIPGVHTVELYRGLEETGLRHVTPRHEQGAGFMADGYARATGRPAACFVITGPGITNIVTAMAQAYGDSVPMLVISAVNALGDIASGAGWLHELKDQRGLTEGVAAFSHTVTSPRELPAVVARAFAVFASGRPRPVHIELPLDIITASADGLPPVAAVPLPRRPGPAPAAIDEAARWLAAAERPVLLLGGGAADVGTLARQFAETLDAPAVMTVNGRGLLAPGHPLAVPCSPTLPPVIDLIEAADLVVAVGTELGPTEFDILLAGRPSFTGRTIRIDIDPLQMLRGPAAGLAIVADAAEALAALLARLEPHVGTGAARAAAARDGVAATLSPAYRRLGGLLATIRDNLPGAILVGDSNQPVYAGMADFAAAAPRHWFCSATGYGTLGYCLPAAVGARLGRPDRPVVAITGDGGFQFSLPELASARECGTPVIVVMWNNRGHGEIRNYMTARGIRPVGVDLFTPDFQALAAAFDCLAVRADTAADLAAALRAAAAADRPTLIEVDEARYLSNSC